VHFFPRNQQTTRDGTRVTGSLPEDASKLFQRKWATTLLDAALCRLEKSCSTAEQEATFRELSPFLIGNQGEETYAEIALRLHTTTAAMAISRMRASYRAMLRQEILPNSFHRPSGGRGISRAQSGTNSNP
jgi:hypothetical protein